MNDLAGRAVQGERGPALNGAFRVLVVDDDPDMAGFLVRLLKQQGLQTEIASDGHEALARIQASPPDLVLLDVQMPGPDGF
jgi:CheY-like chemotaxis protein